MERITDRYCHLVRQRWGIEMKPIIRWDEDQGLLEIGAEPAGPLDEAMLQELMKRGGTAQ